MITGFVTTAEVAQAVEAGIAQAFTSRNLPQFWALGSMPIHTGPHAGKVFLPADEQILSTPLRESPPVTPQDFPEFAQLLALLGGLEARQSISPSDLIDPSISLE
jgi:hypothetical protein